MTDYMVNGKRVPRVSEILDVLQFDKVDGLMDWAASCQTRRLSWRHEREHAADIGTVAHAMIEARLNDEDFDASNVPPSILVGAEIAFKAWEDWYELKQRQWPDMEIIANEQTYVDEVNLFGGTVDCVAKMGGKNYVLDWKTSSRLQKRYHVQVAAYAQLAECVGGHEIAGAYIVRCDKKRGIWEEEYVDVQKSWPIFIRALEITRLLLEMSNEC